MARAAEFQARSALCRYDLSTGRTTSLGVPDGTVEFARTRPGGEVWYMWSSEAEPPCFNTLHEPACFALPGPAAPESVETDDYRVEGPGGPVHTLVSRPAGSAAPYPTILLHGGPDEQDRDIFDPETAAWVDHGFAVVRVNYRGSSGYGREWTEAIRGMIGHTELADVAAVRAWALAEGLADPRRLVLTGASWGGCPTLPALGAQPDLWSLGIASAPVADCVAACEDEREDVKALDRSLFGGSPEEVPERYKDSSPAGYAHAVQVPVLITAA